MQKKPKAKAAGMDWAKLAASLILCQLAGAVGSIFTFPAISGWYASLSKPFFTPPSWVFAPAWTVLYLLMGISLYLVWRKGAEAEGRGQALAAFALQLFLNALWSFLFFGLRSPSAGLAGIVLLWLAIALTIARFYRIEKNAAFLLIPYLLWVTFAALLNLSIWMLNP